MANTGDKKPGNFANDPDKASEAGKKGGQSGGGMMNDPQRTSDAGKKVGRPQGDVNPAIPIAPAANREEGAPATLSKTERKHLT